MKLGSVRYSGTGAGATTPPSGKLNDKWPIPSGQAASFDDPSLDIPNLSPVKGRVFINKPTNPDGSPRGGMAVESQVADTAHVDERATILAGAAVLGEASVLGASIIGDGVVVTGRATVSNSRLVGRERGRGRTSRGFIAVRDDALVECLAVVRAGGRLDIFGDAWVCPEINISINKFERRGYRDGKLVEGGRYGGSLGGTSRIDWLTDPQIDATVDWLACTQESRRSFHAEQIAAIERRLGRPLSEFRTGPPYHRLVRTDPNSTLSKSFVVPFRKCDIQRIEDLLRSGADASAIANVYGVSPDVVVGVLREALGYHPFEDWERFANRRGVSSYTLTVVPEDSSSPPKWVSVNSRDNDAWKRELENTREGREIVWEHLPVVLHFSRLERPSGPLSF